MSRGGSRSAPASPSHGNLAELASGTAVGSGGDWLGTERSNASASNPVDRKERQKNRKDIRQILNKIEFLEERLREKVDILLSLGGEAWLVEKGLLSRLGIYLGEGGHGEGAA